MGVTVQWKWTVYVKKWDVFKCNDADGTSYLNNYWKEFEEYEESWLNKNVISIIALILSILNTGILLYDFITHN